MSSVIPYKVGQLVRLNAEGSIAFPLCKDLILKILRVNTYTDTFIYETCNYLDKFENVVFFVVYGSFINHMFLEPAKPLSAINIEDKNIRQPCSCDFVTVIMRTGCQCGGA